jgi:hypothetical protein
MKFKHTWLYYISIFGIFFSTIAQQYEEKRVLNDSLFKNIDSLKVKNEVPYSIRFGLDIYKTILSQTDENYKGIEFVGDIKVWKDIYAAVEIGNETKTKQSEQINFTTSGTYLKIGIDYNMYKNWKGMNNMVYVGLRVANSIHEQNVNSYTIYDQNRFWKEKETLNGFTTGTREGLNASWIEIVAGMKAQVLKNVYMGFSIRFNRLSTNKKPLNFDNLFIPGFNNKTDENIFGAGFNYSITYNIPFIYRKK